MKKFFESFHKSMFSPDFYDNAQRFTFSDGMRHLVKLSLVFAGVALLVLAITLGIFFGSGKFQEVVSVGVGLYPEELELTVENGLLSINQPEPYMIPLPREWEVRGSEGTNRVADIQNIAVIDTSDDPTLRLAEQYGTAVLIGKDSFGMFSENGKFEIHSIPDSEMVVINKVWVTEKANWIAEKVMYIGIPLVLILTPLFVFSGSLVSILIYLVFGALIIWFISWIKKIPYGYKRSYLVGMYLITAPQILSSISVMMPGIRIPFFGTILLALLASLYLKKTYTQPQEEQKEISSRETKREEIRPKEKTDSDTTPSV